MDARKEVRRAERDAWNRLNSIVEDADWVAGFHQSHAPHLPLLANLRCGAWYVPTACDKGCYFKSTDGHTGQWDFSLKRHNLDLLYTIQRQGGCVIVDSTRRGKSMPDALSKTVPIWCFVMNAASYQRHGLPASTPMQLPPHIVSPSESSQIEARTDRWVQALLSSDLPVPRLEKPLRPLYVTRSHQDKEAQHMGKTDALAYYPVVLISASQMVPTPGLEPLHSTTRASSLNLPRDTEVLRRQSRFIYVQGSGDDEEMWSFKLTPALFWEPAHLRAILGAGGGGEALETVLQRTVKESKQGSVTQNVSGDVELGDFNLFLGTRQRNHSFSSGERLRYRLIVQADGEGTIADGKDREKPEQCQVLQLGISPGKRGLAAFRGAIPTVVQAANKALPSSVLLCSAESGTGNNLVGGLAVATLAACFDEHRERVQTVPPLTKEDIKRRLQWIAALLPSFTPPSRSHLLRVNEVLLSGPYREAVRGDEAVLSRRMAALSSV